MVHNQTFVHGWQLGPSSRGTSDIIWGALVTLALCVWTAIHPNIKVGKDVSDTRRLLQRLAMMLVAVVFPEILISAAWHQRELARKFADPKFQQVPGHLFKNPTGEWQRETVEDSGSAERRWACSQAFFAVMGGFTVDHVLWVDDQWQRADAVSRRRNAHRVTLTVEGVNIIRKVSRKDRPRMLKKEVDARSNADIIAKIFVVGQVLWFAVQTITRLCTHLAVTLLEVHTCVHVGCAILMYFLWWDKPYAVAHPVLLEDETSQALCSLFVFSHIWNSRYAEKVDKHDKERKAYWEELAALQGNNNTNDRPPPTPPTKICLHDAIEQTIGEGQSESGSLDDRLLRDTAPKAKVGLEQLQHCDDEREELLLELEAGNWQGIRNSSENYTLRRVWGGWSENVGHEFSWTKLQPTLWHFLFNLAYGAGHLAAWNSQAFPTPIEKLLWKLSALMISTLFVYGTIWILFWKCASMNVKWAASIRRGTFNIVIGPFFCLVISAYACARCYILIEALISLRKLPASALKTIQWNNILPHST